MGHPDISSLNDYQEYIIRNSKLSFPNSPDNQLAVLTMGLTGESGEIAKVLLQELDKINESWNSFPHFIFWFIYLLLCCRISQQGNL